MNKYFFKSKRLCIYIILISVLSLLEQNVVAQQNLENGLIFNLKLDSINEIKDLLINEGDGRQPRRIKGVFYSALEFDKTSYLDFGPDNSKNQDAISIEAWIKAKNAKSSQADTVIVMKGNYIFGLTRDERSDNIVWAYINGGKNSINVSIESGKWQHIVLTYDRNLRYNQMKVYVNGVLERFKHYDKPIRSAQDHLYLAGNGNQNFLGAIHEVNIYKIAISGDKVWSLFVNGVMNKRFGFDLENLKKMRILNESKLIKDNIDSSRIDKLVIYNYIGFSLFIIILLMLILRFIKPKNIIDKISILFGYILWFMYLYPVINGILDYPYNWPINFKFLESMTLSTTGKWLINPPYTFLGDAFSGDFLILYQYLSDTILNIIAKTTNIPPITLQSVYIGPFLGFIFVLINYVCLLKVFKNKILAFIVSILIAFISDFRLVQFDKIQYYSDILHLPYKTLTLCTAQSFGWLLFIPSLCLLYLAYTNKNKLKYKIYYGIILGIMLQIHSLTLINIVSINIVYISANNLIKHWRIRKGYLLILLFVIIIIMFSFLVFHIRIIPITIIGLFCVIVLIINFIFDDNKIFYLFSYLSTLIIGLPYIVFILSNQKSVKMLSSGVRGEIPSLILIILYLPHILAAIIGIFFLYNNRKVDKEKLIWCLSALIATLALSYNHKLGWSNHPYRFAINLFFPLQIIAGYGIYNSLKLYYQKNRNVIKIILLFISTILSFWFIYSAIYNAIYFIKGPRPYVDFNFGSKEEYIFLSAIKAKTKYKKYILNPPEFNYPFGSAQSTILLNYSKARGFIPDDRYIIHKERYDNRIRVFSFFFPDYPVEYFYSRNDLRKKKQDKNIFQIHNDDNLFLENNSIIKIKIKELKNTIFQIYGIDYITSFGNPFNDLLKRRMSEYKWKKISEFSDGIFAEIPHQIQPGLAELNMGFFNNDGFSTDFLINKSGTYIILLSGNKLDLNIHKLLIDGNEIRILYNDRRIMIAKIVLKSGKHTLTLTGGEYYKSNFPDSADYLYFLNLIDKKKINDYLDLAIAKKAVNELKVIIE